MDSKQLIDRLLRSDMTNATNIGYLFDMARNLDDIALAKRARDHALRAAPKSSQAYELTKDIYKWLAPKDFDSYMIYLEWNREPKARFYMPRRKQLAPEINALQALADDRLDELFLSQPPRTGKTSALLFFITWLLGRDSEISNLYSAYSDIITNSFYNGVLEVLNDPVTYTWHEVFPNSQIAATNSKDETIDLDRKKHYPSLTCRSLYGTLNGACDVRGYLIADDLLSGIEEAMSPDRLMSAWSKVDNNLLPRAVGDRKKVLWIGTRWSIADPIGRRLDLVQNSDQFKGLRWRNINIPAMNDQDESNFDYDYGVGFSTEEYRRRRASFERNNDMASWCAQYMGEPIEREGTVFRPDDFRYFNGVVPDGVPDRVFMAVDPAWGGGDFVAAPVIEKYGNDLYVVDVVYDNSDKRITQKMVADAVEKHHVAAVQVEATKTTKAYADDIEAMLQERGRKINLTTKAAPQTIGGKTQRIFDKAPDIRERMIFLEEGKRSRAYSLFMQNVFSFKMVGKNKNDDAPDSLCMAIDMDQTTTFKTRIIDRLW